VRQFFSDYYAPDACVLSIVGDVDEEEAFAAAERWFGPLAARRDPPAMVYPEVAPHIGREIRETVPDAVPLVRIHFGFRTPPFGTAAFDALEMCTQILAGGKGSRIYRTLVRDRRIAQDVTLFSLPLAAGASICAGWATVRPSVDPAEVEAAFLAELELIAREPVSDDELARARALVEASELSNLGRVEEVADRFGQYATLFDRPEMVNEQLPNYLAVDAAAIQAVAASVFRADNRAVITFVPAAAAEDAA
jgi:predicted Zn-dependent peptidase